MSFFNQKEDAQKKSQQGRNPKEMISKLDTPPTFFIFYSNVVQQLLIFIMRADPEPNHHIFFLHSQSSIIDINPY